MKRLDNFAGILLFLFVFSTNFVFSQEIIERKNRIFNEKIKKKFGWTLEIARGNKIQP